MVMKVRWGRQIAIVGLLCAAILVVLLSGLWGRIVPSNTPADRRPEDAMGAAHVAQSPPNAGNLEITYPLDGTVFPPEIAEPTFRWRHNQPEADAWLVTIEFTDGKEPLKALTHATQWTPSPQQWRNVTARSVEAPAKVTVGGVGQAAPEKLLSADTIRISTSKDEVGAPLFFREVNLPFEMAVTDPAKYIRWRLGPISARQPPPTCSWPWTP